MRPIYLVRLDEWRPAIVLTREAVQPQLSKLTIAPVTFTAKGLSSEVPVGPENGLEAAGAIAVDNTITIPADRIGRAIGHLTAEQEAQLARAVVLAFDLDLPLAA